MEFFRKHGAVLSIGAILAVGSFYLGFNSGEKSALLSSTNVLNKTEGQPQGVDFAPFWRAWNILNEKFVPASTTNEVISDQEKVWGAIQGLASAFGDPYTVFFPPVEAELFESDIRGNFEGVGMEIISDSGAILVVTPLKGSPAERAGIEAGDRIVRIDGRPTTDLTTEDAVQIIRGERGTSVALTIFRNGAREPLEIEVTRDVINIPTIATRQLQNGIFLIELYSFSAQSPELFRQALREFISSGSNRLILDLRGNPGGYLEAAIDMASWFLPSNAVVVKEDFGDGESKSYRSKGYDIFNDNLRFAILVDRGSASASEILAGALSEHNRAVIVGEKTFGKGSVQELVGITSDTSLKVTIARWLTPAGKSISENGIEPDYAVEYTLEDREAGRDPQLEKAVEILTNQ